MAATTLNPLAIPRSSAIADWLELATFVTGRRVMSPASGRGYLDQSGGPSDEDEVALAFATLHDRCNRGMALYPFRFTRLGIERRLDADPIIYQFLLLVAAVTDGTLSLDGRSNPATLLEKFTLHASLSLFGPSTKALRFGHPPEPDRPTDFADAVKWLATRLNARALPLSGATLRRSDGGVDVITWRDFQDGRQTGPVAAIQVTYEGNLRGKSLEIAGNELDRWMAISPPIPVLAAPIDGMDDLDLFDDLSGRVLFLDRWRLIHCVLQAAEEAAEEVRAWTTAFLADLSL